MMEEVFGQKIGFEELRQELGDFQQIAGIREMLFSNGPEAGTRLIQIRNAAGLCVELLPDRCLDIGQVWLDSLPFAWMGSGGLPSRSGGVTVDEALGGLMVTCGFDHIRAPETFEGRAYPQHGSMALRPARVRGARLTESDGKTAFIVEADTVQATLLGSEYRLFRRITVPFSQNTIELEDRLVVSRPAPSFALYHINLGYPLISAESTVLIDGVRRNDLLDAQPTTKTESAPRGPYSAAVEGRHGARGPSLTISTDGSELPWLQTHRRAERGINLFCIEPVTHDRKSHAELVTESDHPFPGERHFSLRFSFAIS